MRDRIEEKLRELKTEILLHILDDGWLVTCGDCNPESLVIQAEIFNVLFEILASGVLGGGYDNLTKKVIPAVSLDRIPIEEEKKELLLCVQQALCEYISAKRQPKA